MVAITNKPGGGKPDKLIRDALIAAARQSPEKLKVGAEIIMQKFSEGDLDAAKFVADRIDGKAVQPLANDYDNPLIPNQESVDARLTELARKAGMVFTPRDETPRDNAESVPSVH